MATLEHLTLLFASTGMEDGRRDAQQHHRMWKPECALNVTTKEPSMCPFLQRVWPLWIDFTRDEQSVIR